jgi:hypothetical protein
VIRGLEIFRDHFSEHTHQYVLIGGAACTLIMEDAGLEFRSTKDLDIVLYIEALNLQFIQAFKEFVRKGGYKNKHVRTEKEVFYRFDSPTNTHFPFMLELFSRRMGANQFHFEENIQRISTSDTMVSLSVILLDEDYYNLIHQGRIQVSGLSVVNAGCLIPLKARAWMDLKGKHIQGIKIDTRDIKKHKNDVFRLYQTLTLESRISLPHPIKKDMQNFLEALRNENQIDLKQLGLRNTKLEEVIKNIRVIYSLE